MTGHHSAQARRRCRVSPAQHGKRDRAVTPHCEVTRLPRSGRPRASVDSCPKEHHERYVAQTTAQVDSRSRRRHPAAGGRKTGARHALFHEPLKLLRQSRSRRRGLDALCSRNGLRTRLCQLSSRGPCGLVSRTRAAWVAVHIVLTMFLLVRPHDAAAADLPSRTIQFSQSVPDGVIVGRAVCGGAGGLESRGSAVWLLNDTHQLIEVALATRTVAVHPIRGLRADDAPWGLACLTDQTLWTLVTPRTVGRIAHDGLIAERLSLQAPSIALFGVGTRLLFESLPLAAASAVFTARSPRRPSEGRPWPGMMVRSAPQRADLLKHNIVNCGLADRSAIPCWFLGDLRVSLSDGTHTDGRAFSWLRGAAIDSSAPLRDVAVFGDRFWLLTGSPRLAASRRVGGALVLTSASGRELGRIEASPPLRVILAATESRCLLLNIRGEVLEVDQP